MNLVGNKENFAIEYQLSVKPNTGNVRLWIANNYIGAIDDNIFLDTFINSLKRIEDLSDNSFVRKELSNGVKMNSRLFLKTNKINGLIGLPENFDDFIIRIFEFENSIYFFWRIVEKPFFLYEGYDNRKAFFCTVRKSLFTQVIEEFEEILAKTWKS